MARPFCTENPLLSRFAGKAKSAEEKELKSQLKHSEEERTKIQETLKTMELQLPLLEKEKLQLQRRFNDVVQELDKTKTDLNSLKTNTETSDQEKKALQSRHEKLLVEFEKSQVELEETRDKKELLEEEKQHLVEENEKNLKEIDLYLDKIEKLTSENTTGILEQGRLRGKLSAAETGLRVLKDCATRIKEENGLLRADVWDFRSAFGDTMSNWMQGFETVVERMKDAEEAIDECSDVSSEQIASPDSKSTSFEDEKEALLEELQINKQCVQTLLSRINELEKEKCEQEERDAATGRPGDSKEPEEAVDSGAALAGVWEECCSVRERLESLQVSYDSQTRRLEELENEKDELKEDKKDLEREAKYLKQVLSYREDIHKVQVNQQKNKQMEQMEENLGAAENKVKDLEGEIGRLHTEKQTLLTSILNLNAEQVMEEEDDDDDDDDDDNDDGDDEEEDDDDESSESETESEEERGDFPKKNIGKVEHERAARIKTQAVSTSNDSDSKSSRREKYDFRRALRSMSTESEYSVFSLKAEDEDDSTAEIDNEEGSRQLKELVKRLREENRQLQCRMDEVTGERAEVLQQFDKLCDDYDSLESRLDRLEEENKKNSEQFKNEKRTLKAHVKDLERERESLDVSLKEVHAEKLALLKCLEMRSEEEVSSERAPSPLPMSTINEIIARAQAFSKDEEQERDSKRKDSSEEESSSEDEKAKLAAPRVHAEEEKRTAPEGRPDATPRVERDDGGELARIVASIETDLGKLKEKLYRKTSVVSKAEGRMIRMLTFNLKAL